jgi:hypothetical protein
MNLAESEIRFIIFGPNGRVEKWNLISIFRRKIILEKYLNQPTIYESIIAYILLALKNQLRPILKYKYLLRNRVIYLIFNIALDLFYRAKSVAI